MSVSRAIADIHHEASLFKCSINGTHLWISVLQGAQTETYAHATAVPGAEVGGGYFAQPGQALPLVAPRWRRGLGGMWLPAYRMCTGSSASRMRGGVAGRRRPPAVLLNGGAAKRQSRIPGGGVLAEAAYSSRHGGKQPTAGSGTRGGAGRGHMAPRGITISSGWLGAS